MDIAALRHGVVRHGYAVPQLLPMRAVKMHALGLRFGATYNDEGGRSKMQLHRGR